jgi:hypothetical protein
MRGRRFTALVTCERHPMFSRSSFVFGTLMVFGASPHVHAQMRGNVAAGKQAYQSSTAYGGEASRAVDGNTDGAFFSGSVTHTDAGPSEWWMVDLGGSYDIRSITVFNRTDCCSERLDARVLVTTTRRPESAVFEGALAQVGERADLSVGAAGRYVWVMQNSANHLQLAEVVVRGAPAANPTPGGGNLALGRRAYQSSTANGGDASRAVDGNTDGAFFSGSVTHTDAGPEEWWMVDLGVVQDIGSITIHNRTDCCGERLDARVVVTETQGLTSPVFIRQLGRVGEVVTVPVGARGRYVWVVQNSANHLQLAEVVVRGSRRYSRPDRAEAFTNVALGKQALQSSTEHGADASRAVDGNTDGAFFSGSVTHTAPGSSEWWMVDLGAPYEIGSISIFNRTDCCGERLDARVLVTMTRAWDEVAFQSQLGRVGERVDVDVGAVGRYVWVLQNSANHLQLAEVVVRGRPR